MEKQMNKTTEELEFYTFAEEEPEISTDDFLLEVCSAMDQYFEGAIRLVEDPDERSILYRMPNRQLFRIIVGRVE